MRKIWLLLFCFCCLQAGAQQDEYERKTDSLLDITDMAMSQHHLPLYLKTAHHLLDLSIQNEDTNSIIKSYIRLVDFYTFSQLNKDSIHRYRAIGLYWCKLAKDLESETDFGFMQASQLLNEGKYVEAYRSFQQLDAIISKSNFDFKGYFYNNYANLLIQLNEDQKAVVLLKKAAFFLKGEKNETSLSPVYSNIAQEYTTLKQFDSAMVYHNKALDIVMAQKDTFRIAETYTRMGITYKEAGQMDKALYYFRTSFEINHKDPTDALLINYTTVLMEEGKNAEAESILTNLKEHGEGPQGRLSAINALILLKKKEGKFKEALALSEEYNTKHQELLNLEKIKQIEELETQYDVAQKENEIKLLNEHNERQATSLRQNKIIVIVSTALFLLTLLALFLIYRNRAIKLKAERILLEQQLLRSQMNPHFIFNCLSNIQSTVLQQEYMKAAGYISTFSKLVRNILEGSTQSHVTFGAELAALRDYLSLQKIRFQNRMHYNIEVDDAIEQDLEYIPPMLFQPLVENALEHGIANSTDGLITIRFIQFPGYIQCVVTDNGVGYGYNTQNMPNPNKSSLSTEIIKKRLSIFSKQVKHTLQYNIEVMKNEKNEVAGTKVSIDIPILS